jgi:hypothetical protein
MDLSGERRDEPQARVQCCPGRGEQFAAACQVDAIVDVAAVG